MMTALVALALQISSFPRRRESRILVGSKVAHSRSSVLSGFPPARE